MATFERLRVVAGGGGASADSDEVSSIGTVERQTRSGDAYVIGTIVDSKIDFTGRFGYTRVEMDLEDSLGGTLKRDRYGITPALGAIWRPSQDIRLRAAGGRTIKRPFVANQTLKPTQVAGFNEQFDDFDGTRADWLGLGFDVRANASVRFGAEALLRWLARPKVDTEDEDSTEHDHRALGYLYWTPTDRLALTAEVIGEIYKSNPEDDLPELRVSTVSLPLGVTYTSPLGWFAGAEAAFVTHDVDRLGRTSEIVLEQEDQGVLIDVIAGYRFPKRAGIFSFQVSNLLDTRLSFQDESLRTMREQINPRFVPSRTFLATLTFNF